MITVQETRARFTACILADMPDDPAATSISPQDAARMLAFLGELQPELRGAALFSSEGTLLGFSGGDRQIWSAAASELFTVADSDPQGPAVELHVASAAGEVVAVTEAGLRLLAVVERFVLASLLTFDMRSVLREASSG